MNLTSEHVTVKYFKVTFVYLRFFKINVDI